VSYPTAEEYATSARRRLAASTRRLVEAIVSDLTASDDAIERAADATDAALQALVDGAGSSLVLSDEPQHGDYLPRSPLVGAASPFAPPFEYDLSDGRLVAHGAFGNVYEGPPGYVHGGWVALSFDEALGMANAASGHPGVTGRLTVRYRRPTPLHTRLTLEAHTANVDGRRVTTVGTLRAGDEVTAEAEGLFVKLGAEQSLEYFGDRPSTPEPTDPLP
jgi:acyl-coenzyme A thioesterase PaaI-like protein